MSNMKKAMKRKLDQSDNEDPPKKRNIKIRGGRTDVKCEKATVKVKKAKIEPAKKENNKYETSEEISQTDKQEWLDHILLSSWTNVHENIAKDLINLFENGNTIPFIVRYRKNVIGNLTIDEIKDARDKYVEINKIKQKATSVIKILEKQGQLKECLRKSIKNATSIEEIDYIYAPFKIENKKTLAARARALGLEDAATSLMNNVDNINLQDFVNKDIEGLKNIEDVEKGVMHIISHLVATNTDVLSFLRLLKSDTNFSIETKKIVTKTNTKVKAKKNELTKNVDELKFENYFDFKTTVKYIKPHQVLAINRGESQKVLSVKVVVPEYILKKFSNFCYNKWINIGKFDYNRKMLLEKVVSDSYTRLIQPLIIREIRSELKLKAEKASIDVFTQNLKQLLLTAPVKGCSILGIDPGFANGCKIALISETSQILEFAVIYPHNKRDLNKENSTRILKNMLLKHKCSLIAIGNGTACRETEKWISDLIANKTFYPLVINYTIVNENGASIYSCSPEAKKEFPDLDPNIISAISLARRIQEPLAELVKVEPKHIGVGMYQHDLSKKRLEESLNEVVSECVSFVGVDLNTTSQCLLRHVAGLTDKKAADIMEYREKNGCFKSRHDIMKVSKIGKRIYEQCIGFLRVGPINKEDALQFYKSPGTNKLDCTNIHPESYSVVEKLLKKLKLKIENVGSDEFIRNFKTKINLLDKKMLSEELQTAEETLKLIMESLLNPLNYDFRAEFSKIPLFKNSVTSILDLKIGTVVTGRVENCTHFGCFVDIGVGCNGLLHTKYFKGLTFQIGDQIEVKVLNVDVTKKRISLEAMRKMN